MRTTRWYAESDTGDLVNNEVYRKALEDAGFDSIIHDADIFNMQNTSGQKHMIIFDPKNVRSQNAKFDPDKIDSSNLTAMNQRNGQGLLSRMA